VEPLYVAAPMTQAPQIDFTTLLARQIAAGLVSVEDQGGGRTLITLTVPDLFASASAGVNQRYAQVIADIGAAADQLPGRLLVTGHTDDQPLRSLQYQDNYELSRARAVQVADIIRSKLRDAGRVEFTGKGSVEPRYRPESSPDNRARNRRVEIVHRRDG
jgi:type VI secretion system protein ImpK